MLKYKRIVAGERAWWGSGKATISRQMARRAQPGSVNQAGRCWGINIMSFSALYPHYLEHGNPCQIFERIGDKVNKQRQTQTSLTNEWLQQRLKTTLYVHGLVLSGNRVIWKLDLVTEGKKDEFQNPLTCQKDLPCLSSTSASIQS